MMKGKITFTLLSISSSLSLHLKSVVRYKNLHNISETVKYRS